MPKCAVRTCRNSSSNIRIKDGISFFHYPRDPLLAGQWWSILAPVVTDSFKPHTAVVCSDHFQDEHKYIARTRHRLKKNAVPDSLLLGPFDGSHRRSTMLLPGDNELSSDEETNMIVVVPEILRPPSESTVCRICLITEGKMERVTAENYEAAYQQVTGIMWNKEDNLPQHLCWECGHRLKSAARFKMKAVGTHNLLKDIRSDYSYLTVNDVKQIDRNYYRIASNLTSKHFPPNQYLPNTTINNNQLINKATDEDINMDNTNTKVNSETDNDKTEMDKIDAIERNFSNVGEVDLEIRLIKSQEDKGNATEDVNTTDGANKSIIKETERDSDDSSDCLIIDAETEPKRPVVTLETIIKTAYVGHSDSGMSIDELIEIYNNDGDGDERLQELNDKFEKTVTDHGKSDGDSEREKVPQSSHMSATFKPTTGWPGTILQIPRVKSKAYAKLNSFMFTITPVSEAEQIAEVAKRQETFRFKRSRFKCYLCYRSFQLRRAYDTHMQRHDPANGAFECSVCKARQKSARAIKTHMYGQHTVRVSCNLCDFVTMNRSAARSHEKWHAGTVYQCPHCPSHFDQESTYKSHLRMQHVHAFVCVLCGFTFVSAKGLAVHRCKRHADAQTIPLEGPYCEICEVRFVSEEAYSRHLKLSSRHLADNAPSFIGVRVAGN